MENVYYREASLYAFGVDIWSEDCGCQVVGFATDEFSSLRKIHCEVLGFALGYAVFRDEEVGMLEY